MVRKPSYLAALICLLLSQLFSFPSPAQQPDSKRWSEIAGNRYIVNPDVVYGVQTIMY